MALQVFVNYINYKSHDNNIGDHIHLGEMTKTFDLDIEEQFCKILLEASQKIVILRFEINIVNEYLQSHLVPIMFPLI